MINLKDNQGQELSIEIIDYEFPDLADLNASLPGFEMPKKSDAPAKEQFELKDSQGRVQTFDVDVNSDEPDYDANWLLLRVKGEKDGIKWEAEDPFLLNWEVEDILTWFQAMAENVADIRPHLYFTEPCLSIYQKESPDGKRLIRFSLSYDIAPPNQGGQKEFFMDFKLSAQEVANLTESIALELSRYPVRNI